MKAYLIMIPISIDGKERYIKELRVKANSVTEAHIKGVALVEKIIENIDSEYLGDEDYKEN